MNLATSRSSVDFKACARSICRAHLLATTPCRQKLISFHFAVVSIAAIRSPAATLRVFECAVVDSWYGCCFRLCRSCRLTRDVRFCGRGCCIINNRRPLANVPGFLLAVRIIPQPAFLMKQYAIFPLFKIVWLARCPRSKLDGSSVNECLEIVAVVISAQPCTRARAQTKVAEVDR